MPYKILKTKQGYKIRKPSGKTTKRNYSSKKAAENTIANWKRYSNLISKYINKQQKIKKRGRGCCRY